MLAFGSVRVSDDIMFVFFTVLIFMSTTSNQNAAFFRACLVQPPPFTTKHPRQTLMSSTAIWDQTIHAKT